MAADPERWNQIIDAAFQLTERAKRRSTAQARLLDLRRLIQRGMRAFPRSIDPVDDFEGYAVRRLLIALRDGLEEFEDLVEKELPRSEPPPTARAATRKTSPE